VRRLKITKFIYLSCIQCPKRGIQCPQRGQPRQNFARMFRSGKTRTTGLAHAQELWWYVKPLRYNTRALQTGRRMERIAISTSQRDKNVSSLQTAANMKATSSQTSKLILAILFDWQRIYLNDSIIGETRTSFSSHQAVVNHFSEFFAYWHVLRARRCTTVHFWNQTCNHLYLKNSTVCVCVFQ